MTNELVVLSGKGGTGKTSVTASFALLSGPVVVADCDVDAPDLHLLLAPRREGGGEFMAGRLAAIDLQECVRCGLCRELCRFDAVRVTPGPDGRDDYTVDESCCEGCGVCAHFCPAGAVAFPPRRCGEWIVSQTRVGGGMAHARLDVPGENSGKLVACVRRKAKALAQERDVPLIIVDGPPGIGCPVIASLTGASHVLLVTEPSPSGEHDLLRVLDLARHFRIPASICVNRWDLNPGMTGRIESEALELGAPAAGRVRYDTGITAAQMRGLAAVETCTPAAADIRIAWETVMDRLQTSQFKQEEEDLS